MAYKNSRLVSNKASSIDFHKLKGSEVNTFSKLQQQGFKAFVKMCGIKNRKLLDLSKQIWDYNFLWEITITAEYFPSVGRISVKAEERPIRIETESPHV